MNVKTIHPHLMISLLAAGSLLSGCGQDQTGRDITQPSKPRFVERSVDNVYPQQGIHAEPVIREQDHWVHLEWYGNPEPKSQGYRNWRQAERDNGHLRYVVKDLRIPTDLDPGLERYSWIDQGDTTSGTPLHMLDPDPIYGTTRGYFWQVEAYDSSGGRSELSDPVYYRLMNNPFNLAVVRDSTDVYFAAWHYIPNPDVIINYYIMRVYPESIGPDSAVWFGMTQQYGSDASAFINFSDVANSMTVGAMYTLQVNVISTHPSPDHADSLAGAAVTTSFTYQH